MKSIILLIAFCTWQPLSAFLDIPFGGTAGLAYDHFRSTPEGDWDGNIGGVWNMNLAAKVPYMECFGAGVQIGGSYGIYDWSGRGSNVSGNPREVQQQGFVTSALTIESPYFLDFNGAIAFDWMMNRNFGVFALPCGISQFRFQGGFVYNCNEFGVLGTVDTHTCHRHVAGVPVSFRAVSYASFYWQRYYENSARTMLWAGAPYKRSLMFSKGRAGKYLVGASFDVPLTNCLSIVGHGVYMQGHSTRTPFQSRTNAANISIGIDYRFGSGCDAPLPYLSIGNNSNFIVDTSLTY